MTKNQGSTLIELLLYSLILTSFLLILTELFVTTLDAQLETQSTSAIAEDGQYLLARLIYDIGRADNIIFPVEVGQTTNQLQLMIEGDLYTYIAQNNNLILTDATVSAQLNSNEVQVAALSFTKIATESAQPQIKIAVNLQSLIKKTGIQEQSDIQTTVGLR